MPAPATASSFSGLPEDIEAATEGEDNEDIPIEVARKVVIEGTELGLPLSYQLKNGRISYSEILEDEPDIERLELELGVD